MAYKKNVWKSKDRITKEKLNNIEEGIYEAHRLIGEDKDLSLYQLKKDNSLLTSNKDISGAINELFQSISNRNITGKILTLDNKKYTLSEDDNGNITATIINGTSYTITRNLSNCTSNNTTNSVNQGVSYSATITPNSGYELLNVAITMGGTNITSSVYTYQNGNAVINIPSVTGNVVITVQATATSTEPIEPATYTITRNLTNCTSSNATNSVNQGASYSTTIAPNDNYTLETITVTMNGTDVTDTAVNIETETNNATVSGEALSVSGSVSGEALSVSGAVSEETLSGTSSNATRYAVVNISNVTGNIVISATAVEITSGGEEETTYTITRNLSNCTSNNTTNSVNQGASYSATITPNSGYELLNVAITMGGTNVTSSVYTYQNGNAVINIPSVTGNVVITVQATASSSSGGGEEEPPTILSNMTYGKGVNLNTGVIRDDVACWATVEPVTIVNGKTYTISVDGTYLWILAINDNGDPITPFITTGTNSKPQSFTFTATTSKIRYGCYDPDKQLTYCNLTEVTSSVTTYTITKNLPNCTSSNTASSVNENTNYSTLISANDGYKIDSITVTMGGTDITSSVVTDE